VRLFVITRHAHSQLNLEHRVNGDPSVEVALTEQGVEEARRLGVQLANLPLELCVHTRFGRTRRTAEVALEGRDVPFLEEPLLDDVYVGELEGRSVDEYRRWKAAHTRSDRFPGGESLDESARRYAQGFRRLLARPEQAILVVGHEIPLRYALNAAAGSDDLDGPAHAMPNATPYLFSEEALACAADRIEALTPLGHSAAGH
jgi:broad specificity phosphatase PhoE